MKPLDEAVAAVEAVLAAGRDAGHRLRAQRAHRRLRARPTAAPTGATLVDEAIRRGRAFLEAGAPVVFVPGAVAREEIAALVDGLRAAEARASSASRARRCPSRELQELGVARVSTGPFTQRVALTALQDATARSSPAASLPEGTRALN